jgi:hypothetical protein
VRAGESDRESESEKRRVEKEERKKR